jgi:hypothetical protein
VGALQRLVIVSEHLAHLRAFVSVHAGHRIAYRESNTLEHRL